MGLKISGDKWNDDEIYHIRVMKKIETTQLICVKVLCILYIEIIILIRKGMALSHLVTFSKSNIFVI